MNIRLFFLFSYALLMGSISFIGCFSTTGVQQTHRVVTFDYKPPEGERTPVNIGLVLVSPHYAENFTEKNSKLFVRYIKAMSDDFEEMISARGYRISEPVTTFDELTYSEKKQMDLFLKIEVDMHLDPDRSGFRSDYNYLVKQNVYSFDGNVTLSGKINLSALETMTQQKLWVKSIPLASTQVYTKSANKYYTNTFPVDDVGIHNALADALEASYATVLKTAWRHLEPEGLLALKPQIKELRENKKY